MKNRTKGFTLVELPFDRLRTIRKRKGKAFTLVELLVVVAIIALLVSILLPTLNKAKEQTRRVICASNIRNCGTAMHVYAAANDGYFPPADWNNDGGFQANAYYNDFNSGERGAWDLREFIGSFVGDFDLWKCPALPMAASIDDPANTRFACYGTYRYYPGRRYPQFADSSTEQYNNPLPQPYRHENVDNAAGRVMMQDTYIDDWRTTDAMFNHGQGVFYRWIDVGDENPSQLCKLGSYGDGDGANLLFYDGHAEWVGYNGLEAVGSTSQSWPLSMAYSRLP